MNRKRIPRIGSVRLWSVLAALSGLVVLVGFSFGEVRLTVNKPLIDLQETVQKSSLGDEDTFDDTVPESEAGEEDPVSVNEDSSASDDPGEEGASAEKVAPKKVTIRIQETRIFLDNASVSSGTELVNRLAKMQETRQDDETNTSGIRQVLLVDDYADYRTYRDVRSALTDAAISFTEEVTP